MFKNYLMKNHSTDLLNILESTDSDFFHSITVNYVSLFEFDMELAQKILCRPREQLPLCDCAAIAAQEDLANEKHQVKQKVRVRITAVPETIDHGEIGQLVRTTGIVVRTSQPTVMKLIRRSSCKKCKHITLAKWEWERSMLQDIKQCEACRSAAITVLTSYEQDDCSDCQEIKLQEKRQGDETGTYSVGLHVVLLDDLIDVCRPGDNVVISGIIIRKWGILKVGQRMEATTFMLANSVSVLGKISDSTFSTQETENAFENYWKTYKNDPLVGRDKILASICPKLYGMYLVKLSLAVVLAGGVTKTNDSGTRVRGESHLLFIGDPGTGKSQMLRTASRLAARSVLTTGIGSTAAGLTAAAVKDNDGWHLEGGALVLADGGVCCIDEFSTMNSHDRASVHEAMEQQTISVAKAGIVSTLNCRCTVVAAINPEGGLFIDGEEWKTRLGNPLLSRFDLILLIRDHNNPEWDELTARHVLMATREPETIEMEIDSMRKIDLSKTDGLWKEDSLKEYFTYIHFFKPIITKEAEQVLSAAYLYHRSDPTRRAERRTVRLLDSLIRLAEGHAKLMCRHEVLVMDAIIATELIGSCTITSDTDIGNPFPQNPMESYLSKGKDLLSRLKLKDLEMFL